MPELETRHVDGDLGRIRVRVCGSGPVVVFWPNHYLTGLSGRRIAEYFADRFTVVLIDPPGHGGSDRLDHDISTAECVAVVCDVLDALAYPSAHLVGIGWGAQIALFATAMHRDRIESAALVNASPDPARRRGTLRSRLFQRVYAAARWSRPLLSRRLVTRLLGRTSLERRRDVVAQIRYAIRSADPVSVRHGVRAVLNRRADHSTLASTIQTPVLVVAGAEDRTIPLDEGRRLSEHIRGARFVVLDEVGHTPQVEAPDRLNYILDRFWSTLPQVSPRTGPGSLGRPESTPPAPRAPQPPDAEPRPA